MLDQDFEILTNQAVLYYNDPSLSGLQSSQTNTTVTLAYHTDVGIQSCYTLCEIPHCKDIPKWAYNLIFYIYNNNSITIEQPVVNLHFLQWLELKACYFYFNGYSIDAINYSSGCFGFAQIPPHTLLTVMAKVHYKGQCLEPGTLLSTIDLSYSLLSLNSSTSYHFQKICSVYQ